MPVRAYIGFGTNLGDLYQNFSDVRDRLMAVSGLYVLRVSPLYRTEPLTQDGERQPWYLNGVFEIETDLDIKDLHRTLQGIELAMGRRRHRRWKSRVMDLDLLFYGDTIYADKDLRVPHREIIHRRFVLAPLVDLIPEWPHPEFLMPLDEILVYTKDALRVVREQGREQAVA